MRLLDLEAIAVILLLFFQFIELRGYQVSSLPEFKPVGCYRDSGARPRPLPAQIKNLRPKIDWFNLNKTIEECARIVYATGFHYFGIQFYGECWSGKRAEITYKKHGPSRKCFLGVGGEWANYVYAFVEKEIILRLANGFDPRSGRVEVFHRGIWGTVCGKSWDLRDANVACKMLGYPRALSASNDARFGKGRGKIALDAIHCKGSERNLAYCPHKDYVVNGCSHARDAGVVCGKNNGQPRVPYRLSGGATHSEGRVEVYYARKWGTICDKGWDLTDARIVCRMLAYNDAVATPKYDQGSGTIWLNNVSCTGAENSIFRCAHAGWGNVDGCDHSNDAGVKCQ